MDWIRRNWPDLLIGLALLAVIGGIIATLLNGGNFLPGNRNVNVTTPSSTVVSSGGNDSTTPTETTISPDLPSGTATLAGDNGETTGTITPVDVSAVPATEAVTTTAEAATESIEAAVDETLADASTSEVAATQDVSALSSETSPYRISVGAFGSAENAERRAETFRSAGYPVFVAKQGDLSLVLIGPYDNQTAAQQAVSQIQSSGLEANPIIYEFTPTDATQVSSAGDETTASEATSAPVEATPETTPSETTETTVSETPSASTVALQTSNTGRYLQVGAYGSVESAQPQLVKLQGLGFSVTYIEESEKIKLLVGPYEGATLETAKAQLQAQGIDHFVR
jgi:cell division septation protein DedD